jgi:hypothetical protein
VRARVEKIIHRVDIHTLEREQAEQLQMNDIATVEIETSSPLFFDAYQKNRITGSFIMIDPLTNATVGAGMIQRPSSASAGPLPASLKPGPESAVANVERYRRHGHYPAIFFVNARPALTTRIERALFEAGFEVIVVDATKPSLLSAKDSWAILYATGFVVIYSNPSLEAEEQVDLKTVAGNRYFNLGALDLATEDDAVRHIVSLADTLRMVDGKERGN